MSRSVPSAVPVGAMVDVEFRAPGPPSLRKRVSAGLGLKLHILTKTL
jgi:hypothetical protein